ncbi:pectinesterase inhibitor 6-like [Tasmannia lanceolata]|uniref:pectinesterase inhibitor 6-like n=1 Tax=Tasmannia lanceolata TaxID=3420 RepID=UPI004063A281
MASRLSFTLVLLVASLALLGSISGAAAHRRPYMHHSSPSVHIYKICRHARHLGLCMAVAHPMKWAGGRVHGPIGPEAICKSSIHATIQKVVQARALATKLTQSHAQNTMSAANLNVCREVYTDALGNLMVSIKNMDNRASADLNINLSAVISDVSTCEDGFMETPGVGSPLTKINSVITKLASNNLDLASKLKI